MSGQEGFQQQPRAESGTEPLSAMSQSPKSKRGLCKSVSILGRPVFVDVHCKCGAATSTALSFHIWYISNSRPNPSCKDVSSLAAKKIKSDIKSICPPSMLLALTSVSSCIKVNSIKLIEFNYSKVLNSGSFSGWLVCKFHDVKNISIPLCVFSRTSYKDQFDYFLFRRNKKSKNEVGKHCCVTQAHCYRAASYYNQGSTKGSLFQNRKNI